MVRAAWMREEVRGRGRRLARRRAACLRLFIFASIAQNVFMVTEVTYVTFNEGRTEVGELGFRRVSVSV